MRCRALTIAGTRCTNRRFHGQRFCARHAGYAGPIATDAFADIMAAEPIRRQPETPVPYEALAMTLRESSVPREHISRLCADISEALHERDERFDPESFARVVLS